MDARAAVQNPAGFYLKHQIVILNQIGKAIGRALPETNPRDISIVEKYVAGSLDQGSIDGYVLEVLSKVNDLIYNQLGEIGSKYLSVQAKYDSFDQYLYGAINKKVLKEITKGRPSNREVLRYIVERKKEETRRYWISVLKYRWYKRVQRILLSRYTGSHLYTVVNCFFDVFIRYHYATIRETVLAQPGTDIFDDLTEHYEAFLQKQSIDDLKRQLAEYGVTTPLPEPRMLQEKGSSDDENSVLDFSSKRLSDEGSARLSASLKLSLRGRILQLLGLVINCRNPSYESAKAELVPMLSASDAKESEIKDASYCLASLALKNQVIKDNDETVVRNVRIYLIRELSHHGSSIGRTKSLDQLALDQIHIHEIIGQRYSLDEICMRFGMPQADPNIPRKVEAALQRQLEHIDL